MSWADRISQNTFRILLYLLGCIVLLQVGFYTAVYIYGPATTVEWITAHPALTLFLTAIVLSIFPVYSETSSKLKRIWKETNKATLLVTLASFFVYYRSFAVTPNGPLEAMLYNFGGRAWYLTGLILVLNLIGLPVASAYTSND